MSDSPPELDLKFLPDWVKESAPANRYADYQGETSDRPHRDRDDRGPRGPRPERRGPGGPPPSRRPDDRRGPGGLSDRRGPGGPRPPQGDRPRGPRPGGDRPRPGSDRPRDGRPDQRHSGRHEGDRGDRPQREAPQRAPAELRVDFLPEPNAAAGIAKQIKASGRAYPVFGTSKLFLERPERHRVRVTSADPAVPLFQVGDGPISFDRASVERNAFFSARAEFYTEETLQGEPIKGNFSNVARVRATGALLGPTNYHGYQPALRKLYEERFSRRMSFPEFQQHEIEIVSDEQAVADWKEQARSSTIYTTTKETEPVIFKSAFDAEQHFRKQYLPTLVKSGQTLECSGQASRAAGDRFVAGAVRGGWEQESHFPQQIVNGLRSYFVEAGLHFFKHRKRVLYVSATKPARHPAGQIFSDGITAILHAVETTPRLKRPDLAAKILGAQQDAPEAAALKEQLASDLHYLIHAGHVIEFSNGMLELPLAPQEKPAAERPGKPMPSKSAATAVDASTVQEAEDVELEQGEPEPAVEAVIASSSAPAEVEAMVAEPEVMAAETEAVVVEPETTLAEAEPATIETTASAPVESVATVTEAEAPSTVVETPPLVMEASSVAVETPIEAAVVAEEAAPAMMEPLKTEPITTASVTSDPETPEPAPAEPMPESISTSQSAAPLQNAPTP